MLRDRAILDLPEGNIGSPDDPVQGRFVFAGNLQIIPSFRSGFLVGGAGAQITNAIQEFSGQDGEKGKGFFIDAGGGPHVVGIEFRGWEGAKIPTKYDENDRPIEWDYLQWGNTGDAETATYADATGGHPLAQLNTLEQYLRHIKIDSNSPAQLQYGDFSEEGRYEPLDVVLEGPEFTRAADMPVSAFDGTLTFIEAAVVDEVYSAIERTG